MWCTQARKALAEPHVACGGNVAPIATLFRAAAADWAAADAVVPELDTLLATAEHVPPALVDLVATCAAAEPPQPRALELPQRLLAEVLSKAPGTYSELAKRKSGGVANVADFLKGVAERCAPNARALTPLPQTQKLIRPLGQPGGTLDVSHTPVCRGGHLCAEHAGISQRASLYRAHRLGATAVDA